MRNLARPPYASEPQLLAAISAGSCALGLVSESAARDAGLEISIPDPSVVVIEAVGVARHARSAESARRLVEWLIGEDAQRSDSESRGHRAVNPQAMSDALPSIRHPSYAGAFDPDAERLAERVAWR